MLSGRDTVIVGMWDEGAPLCRGCAVKRYGILYVELLEHGLREPQDGMTVRWGHESMCRFEADEAAVEWGYEIAHEQQHCYPRESCKATQNEHGDWFCDACAETRCEDCGERLDWSQGDQDAAEYAAAERGEDLPAWP